MGWGSGPSNMDEEAELEEGEAYGGDTSIDPDIALSYLDEKVQSVLGHFQKDFEGGVSAENLGAKFGGYGSFLPTHQRSPSIWSQSKSPQRVQTQTTARSPMYREVAGQNATTLPDAPLSQRNGTPVNHGVHVAHEKVVQLGDVRVRQDSCLSSSQVTEKLLARPQATPNKSLNPNDQKPLKFRIKVGSDKTTQKNAAIYSGLGLASPSSSTGNSPGESGGNLFESQENPDESWSCILQMLTSFTIAKGLLVSPLHDKFVNLVSSIPMESNTPEASVRLKHNHSTTSAGDSTSRSSNEDLLTRKLKEAVGKSEKYKESSCGKQMGFEDDMVSRLGYNPGAERLQSKESFRDTAKAHEAFTEHENGVLLMKREASKDKTKGRVLVNELVKDEPFESISGLCDTKFEHRDAKSCPVEWGRKNKIKSSQKDVPVDHSEALRSKANRIPASLKAESDISASERDSKWDIGDSIYKVSAKATPHEHDELRVPLSAKKVPSESKKKSNGGQVKGKQFVDSAELSGRPGVSAVAKQKGIKRDVYKVRDIYKDLFETNSATKSKSVDALENPSGNRSKELNVETVKEKKAHADRLKGDPNRNNLATGSLPVNNGLQLVTEQATVAPVLIEENWVCCDQCQTWRLLPYGTKPEDLPEKWLCSMLNWLPGMNHCDISEEDTTKALHALYQLPAPENQHGIQNHADRPATGVHSVDEHLLNQNFQNVGFDHKADRRKKTSKEKNFQQDLVKRGSSQDMKQNPVNRSISKSETAVKKHLNRQKQEHVSGGDVKPKRKSKSKRETDQYEHEGAKKSKTKGAYDTNNFQASAVNLGHVISSHTISPRMTSMKDNPKHGERDYLKDVKPSDGALGLLGNASVDMMRKSNDGEISLKKRKLKDWQNSQNYAETLQNDGSQLNDRNVPVKEESSDSGFRRDKKLRVSQTEEGSSRSKSSAELKRKDTKTRMLASACNKTIDSNLDKPKQLNKYKVKITSQLTMEDLESLKKDLGCEPVSTAATSSSSKVSDSRKNRTNYQGVKGSPVESVSSSPTRMSSLNKLSPDGLGKDDVKVGEFPIKRSPVKFVDRDVNCVTNNRSSTANKRKNADVLNPDSADNHMLQFQESDARDKLGLECELGVRPSLHFENGHLDILEGYSICPTDVRASEPCYSKDRIGKSQHNTVLLHKQPGKASSFLPKDKVRSSDLNSEGAVQKVSDLPTDGGVLKLKTNSKVDKETYQNHVTSDGVLLDDKKYPSVSQSRNKSVKTNKSISKRESRIALDDSREDLLQTEGHRRSGAKLSNPCGKDASNPMPQDLTRDFGTVKNISAVHVCSNGKSLVDCNPEDEHEVLPSASKLASGTQNENLLDAQNHDVSVCGDASKLSKGSRNVIHQNEPHNTAGNPAPDQSVVRDLSDPTLVRRDGSGQAAPTTLKEAEDLRNYADSLKTSGFSFEYNEVNFQAALKFLQAASLLESNSENSKPGETNQMQIYSNTAKLCETCAHEYERRHEMAAAALAYKCMEVAYLRVVYCNNTITNRLFHDLQASLHIVPQGDSPSSSASDIDNLNNQALVEKASLSKSNGSHSGNHVIAPRTRPSFFRLHDFTKDVYSAMEASRKSQNAFSAAHVILEESQNKEGIVAVKRVIDFSFQDVEELVRLVRIAIEAISQKGLVGGRD